MKYYKINTDLGIDYQDAGPWRSYVLTAQGTTFKELLKDATIEEVDQDGGTLNYYGIEDAPTNKIREVATKELSLAFKESYPTDVFGNDC